MGNCVGGDAVVTPVPGFNATFSEGRFGGFIMVCKKKQPPVKGSDMDDHSFFQCCTVDVRRSVKVQPQRNSADGSRFSRRASDVLKLVGKTELCDREEKVGIKHRYTG